MNKDDLIAQIAKKEQTTKKEARKRIQSTLKGILSVLKSGEELALVGFGTFRIWNREPRMAQNPLTGAKVKIPEKNYIRFGPGAAFREAINLRRAIEGARKQKLLKEQLSNKSKA